MAVNIRDEYVTLYSCYVILINYYTKKTTDVFGSIIFIWFGFYWQWHVS